MTGFELRGRLNAFDDVLTDIEAFLEEKGIIDKLDLIGEARDALEDLFYLIPLDEEAE